MYPRVIAVAHRGRTESMRSAGSDYVRLYSVSRVSIEREGEWTSSFPKKMSEVRSLVSRIRRTVVALGSDPGPAEVL